MSVFRDSAVHLKQVEQVYEWLWRVRGLLYVRKNDGCFALFALALHTFVSTKDDETVEYPGTIIPYAWVKHAIPATYSLATSSQHPIDASDKFLWTKLGLFTVIAAAIPLEPMPEPDLELTVSWLSMLTCTYMDPIAFAAAVLSSDLPTFVCTRVFVHTTALLTQLIFEHSLRIRMKAEVEKDDDAKYSEPIGNGRDFLALYMTVSTYATYALIMHEELNASKVFSGMTVFDMFQTN
ncbi:hypothetical protein M422DRAFT_274408 [Sphaerobolus stellatus SS14]|uniref:Uncharacterized protein n=1 Tax=Sphaerobolus stellatus (strain SS14) TaxID=990650 RepID=A0A0C9T6Z6_SPHS4|nr:hypothetical protein M422DRAFT_274408 [Sphaerobolus stellatus SS14]